MFKINMVYPSPFDEADYGKIEPRMITIHWVQPKYDERGYCISYGYCKKRVSRDLKTNKIISIKP